MTRRSTTEKVLIANAVVSTSGALDVVIPAQPGWVIGINQLMASNQENAAQSITFYEETSKITPHMTLGASGTLFIDEFGGDQFELHVGSGLFAGVTDGGNVEVTIYYVLHDERTPLTKSDSRATSLVPTITRTPNQFGGQTNN